MKKLQKIVPTDVKLILKMYLQSMEDIKSQTEIQEEAELQRRRNTPARRVKIVVLGAGAVGKTSTIYRFVEDRFYYYEYGDPMEDYFFKSIEIDGYRYDLDIQDTQGQDQFTALRDHWIREADALILMYTIRSLRTFEFTKEIYRKILRQKEDVRFDLILVGNMNDVPDGDRQVTHEMGKKLADEWNVPFIEQSAKTGHNVQEAWELLVKDYMDPKEHLYGEKNLETDDRCLSCMIM